MLRRGPTVHVDTALGNQFEHQVGAQPMDLRQVRAQHIEQPFTQLEGRRVAIGLGMSRRWHGVCGNAAWAARVIKAPRYGDHSRRYAHGKCRREPATDARPVHAPHGSGPPAPGG